jgi:hypothetical protein
LIPPPDYPIYFLSEKDVLRSNKTARGPKPHGGNTQGTPQSRRSRSRTKAGITGRQWSQMAYYQSQSSRSRDCQMGVIEEYRHSKNSIHLQTKVVSSGNGAMDA